WTPAEHDPARALAHEQEAKAVVTLAPHYTSVSAAWLPQAEQWVVVYSRAINDTEHKKVNPAGPVVARFGANPRTWSDEGQIFQHLPRPRIRALYALERHRQHPHPRTASPIRGRARLGLRRVLDATVHGLGPRAARPHARLSDVDQQPIPSA